MGPNGNNSHVTKQDFEEFKVEIRELIGSLAKRIDEVELHLSQRLERALRPLC